MKKMISTLVLLAVTAVAPAQESKAKNVILMISDGLGFNGWEAARNFEGALPYDNAGFTFYGCTNYSANHTVDSGYSSDSYWNDFSYQDVQPTDSASAATALYTGTKIYDGQLNVTTTGGTLKTIAEFASAKGYATGAVSSVEFSHATPAAVAAHNVSRNNYAEIANEMIYNSNLDVIMGAGLHGNTSNEKYVGGMDTASAIMDASANGTTINGFTTITEVADFQALANGSIATSKVLGATYGTTLGDSYQPGQNDESIVPTLDTMTKGALNVLSQNDNGFFLMVEGGAVDWQNHANLMDRMITEQVDFDNAVASTMEWIEANGGWEENLLIVTADHETGGIWGSDGYTHVGNPGEGIVPTYGSTVSGRENLGTAPASGTEDADVVYNSGNHTNSIVPLWTKGAGSEAFAALIDGVDSNARNFWSDEYGWDASWDGSYVDNTDVFTVMMGTDVPEPCTIALLGLGGVAAFRRRRNA